VSADEITHHLAEAARLWCEEHAPLHTDDEYRAAHDEFMWTVDHAYDAAAGDWREANEAPELPSSGHVLYRLWAADGRLLYVGVSRRPRARIRSHHRKWGDLIAKVTWESHPDERSMLAAERQAIRDEHPALNRALVG
jgi:hypothetical protein